MKCWIQGGDLCPPREEFLQNSLPESRNRRAPSTLLSLFDRTQEYEELTFSELPRHEARLIELLGEDADETQETTGRGDLKRRGDPNGS